MKLDRCIDRQYLASFGWMCAVYPLILAVLVSAAWSFGVWAAAGFFAFMLWAYRWPLGVKIGRCARRPGAIAWDAPRNAS